MADELTPLTSSSIRQHYSATPSGPRRRALHTRWQSFAGIALFVSVVGTTYAFGIFSSLLRTYLGYSQDELDLIASIGNNGLYLSLVAGFLIDRIGFKRVVRIGGVLIFVGFFYIWLAVQQHISSNMATISFFYFISQLGVCFHVAVAITVSVKLFPHSAHGGAIGLMKGYFGMSSAVLGDIAGGIFNNYPIEFLLFVAVFIPTISFYGVTQANILPPHLLDLSYEHRKGMYASLDPFIIHWSVLFLTLALVGYCEYAYDLDFLQELVTMAMIFIVVFSILYIPQIYGETNIPVEDCISASSAIGSLSDDQEPYYEERRREEVRAKQEANRRRYLFSEYLDKDSTAHANGDKKKSSVVPNLATSINSDNLHAPTVTDNVNRSPRTPNSRSHKNHSGVIAALENDFPDFAENDSLLDSSEVSSLPLFTDSAFYGDGLPLMESLKTWRLWALFVHYLISSGVGLMVIYNVDSIAEAVDKEPTSFFVTLIALSNGLGRVFAGWMSDHSYDFCGISKLLLLTFVVSAMSIVQFVLSFGLTTFLFPGFLLVGFLFGCTVALTAINVADIFGEKYIATNFGFVDASPIFGSYLYATFLVSMFYNQNATIASSGESTCFGPDCFRSAFLLNAASCVVGASICYYLHRHTPR